MCRNRSRLTGLGWDCSAYDVHKMKIMQISATNNFKSSKWQVLIRFTLGRPGPELPREGSSPLGRITGTPRVETPLVFFALHSIVFYYSLFGKQRLED